MPFVTKKIIPFQLPVYVHRGNFRYALRRVKSKFDHRDEKVHLTQSGGNIYLLDGHHKFTEWLYGFRTELKFDLAKGIFGSIKTCANEYIPVFSVLEVK